MDVVFISVSGDFSKEYAKAIAEGDDGAVVIDNSSAFRYDKDVALCVPEINADAARKNPNKVIANPNCTTAIGIMALFPLHKRSRQLDRVSIQHAQVRPQEGHHVHLSSSLWCRTGRNGRAEGRSEGGCKQCRRNDREEQDLRPSAAIQSYPTYRRLPGQPLHQGGDEGDLGVPQDHGHSFPSCVLHCCKNPDLQSPCGVDCG
mmetsp:Transcript_24802/g.81543  ORF Transcript_24802/g.81543 Transcript_24802/m.81543 type:complete len:203 (+) Transcript_24802:561-1169(+)